MKILLYTFTGTGNTELCGNFIADSFKKEGHEVVHFVYDSDKEFKEDINGYDWICILIIFKNMILMVMI